MTSKIPAADLDYAEKLVRSGGLLKDAATELGVIPDVLSVHLRARGVDTSAGKRGRPAHNRANIDTDEAIRRYAGGESMSSIAKSFGVTRPVLFKRFVAAGARIRTASECNTLRMQRLSIEDRRALSASAREAHMLSMAATADHHSVGIGEVEIADALRACGHKVASQVRSGQYNIDLVADGSVAIEVKQAGRKGYGFFRQREVDLIERGFGVVIVRFEDPSCISERLHEIVALTDFACRHPAPAGKHWVVRCGLNKRAGSVNTYDTAFKLCANKLPQPRAK